MEAKEKVDAFIEGIYPHTPPSEFCTVLFGFTAKKPTADEQKLLDSETAAYEKLLNEGAMLRR